jgi:hypothetical protein
MDLVNARKASTDAALLVGVTLLAEAFHTAKTRRRELTGGVRFGGAFSRLRAGFPRTMRYGSRSTLEAI